MDAKQLARPSVLKLLPYQTAKPLYQLKQELGTDDVIKLASNENPIGPSKLAIEAAQLCISQVHHYPDAHTHELKKALSEHLKTDTDRLITGNGTNYLLGLIAQCFLNPGDESLFSQYSFMSFKIHTLAHLGQTVIVPAKNWGNDLAALLAAITDKTKLIFIANPNNPTGTWINQQGFVNFLEKVPSNILVVSDEAYFEFVHEDEFPDTVKLQDRFPNLITTRTFSKVYGLAGLRVGYAIAHPNIIDVLQRVRLPFCVTTPAQVAATAALTDQAHIEKTLQVVQQGREQLEQAFQELGLQYIPSVTNFYCVDMADDSMTVYNKLLEHGVIVRPLLSYNLDRHLRISVGSFEENQKLINALKVIYRK